MSEAKKFAPRTKDRDILDRSGVDKESVSYIRGRYGVDSLEYKRKVAANLALATNQRKTNETNTKGVDMNSDAVYDAIEEIAAESGKKAKQELISKHMENPDFVKIVKLALDPFITYGVKKFDEHTTGDEEFAARTFETLEHLAARQLTGKAAAGEIQSLLSRHTEKSGELLKRIIKKDLRAGFTADSINRSKPGTIFVFKCQLAHKYDLKRVTFPVAIEAKYDGVRGLMIIDKGEVGIYSRTGKRFVAYDGLCELVKQRLDSLGAEPSIVLDGEVVSGNFNSTVGAARRQSEQDDTGVFMVFDHIQYSDFPASDKTYLDRRKLASLAIEALKVDRLQLSPAKLAKSEDDIHKFYKGVRDQGGEGVIVKSLKGSYDGSRSYDWLKIKGCETADVVIVGFNPGDAGKKYEHTLGTLVIDYKGVEVKVPDITEEWRHEIWNNRDKYLGRLIEVEFHEVTPAGSLRHPRFMRFRDDKPVEDGVGC